MLFAEEVREMTRQELQSEGSSGSVAQVGRRTGEKWRALEQHTREAYNRAAQQQQQQQHDDGEDGAPAGDSSWSAIPLSRVKRIAKLDREVSHVNADAAKSLKHAAELFIETLASGCSARLSEKQRKGGVRYQDLEDTVLRQPRLGFLHDHVYALRPREGSKPTSELPGTLSDTSNRPITQFLFDGQQPPETNPAGGAQDVAADATPAGNEQNHQQSHAHATAEEPTSG